MVGNSGRRLRKLKQTDKKDVFRRFGQAFVCIFIFTFILETMRRGKIFAYFLELIETLFVETFWFSRENTISISDFIFAVSSCHWCT